MLNAIRDVVLVLVCVWMGVIGIHMYTSLPEKSVHEQCQSAKIDYAIAKLDFHKYSKDNLTLIAKTYSRKCEDA